MKHAPWRKTTERANIYCGLRDLGMFTGGLKHVIRGLFA